MLALRPTRIRRDTASTLLFSTLLLLAWLTGATALASNDGDAVAEDPVYKVLVLPYWNLSGREFEQVEEGIARQLTKSSSALAQQPRFDVLPYDTTQKVLLQDLTSQERKSFAAFLRNGTKHGDLLEAEPILQSILHGAKADLLIFGSFRKIGSAQGLAGRAKVESLLLFRAASGDFDEPVVHEFRIALDGSFTELYRGVAADNFWIADKMPAQYILQHGTMQPSAWDLQMEDWRGLVEKDRWTHVLEAFPDEFLHAQTCKISDQQRAYSALASDQLVHLERERQNPRPFNYRGMVEFCGGNEPAAIERFQQAAQIDPTYPDAWYNLGVLEWRRYRRDGNQQALEASRQAFTEALELEAGFAEAHAKRALVLMEQKKPREAKADLTRAMQEDSDNPDVLLARCYLAFAEKHTQAAAQHCNAATRKDPEFAEAYKILGDIYIGRRMTKPAVDAYRRAGEIDRHYFEARIPLLQALFRSKRYDEVETEARDMMTAIENHSVPHYWLGKACEASGDLECALEGYEGAQRIDPNWTALANDILRIQKRIGSTRRSSAPTQPRARTARSTTSGKAATSYEEFLRKYEQSQQQ